MKTKMLVINILMFFLVSCAPASTLTPTNIAKINIPSTETSTPKSITSTAKVAFTPVPTTTTASTQTATFSATPSPTSAFTPTHTPKPGTTSVSAIDGMVMAYIPAGTFQMGSNKGLRYGEDPIHSVTLNAFLMDTAEVTLSKYYKCVETWNCSPPITSKSYTRPNYYGNSQYDSYPVIFIRWDQAVDYCQWAGRRLPTEAEWEYAARGGLEGMEYPWGDEFDPAKANFCDKNCPSEMADKKVGDRFTETAPAHSYLPNSYGLYEMAGNVAEWVNDWYGSYTAKSVTNPKGPTSGESHVIRGGSWVHQSPFLSVAARDRAFPEGSGDWIGFRCASDTP